MIDPVFTLPIGVGIVTALLSFVVFRRDGITPQYFAIALLISAALVLSPVIFYTLEGIKQLFNIRFTFVLGFGITNVVTLVIIIYLLLVIGNLRNEITTLWQEIALLESEQEETDSSQR